MREYFISEAADADIKLVLRWTQNAFGIAARNRYESLLIGAIRDIVKNPRRTGIIARPEIGPELKSYHLWHSRKSIAKPSERVKRPRHFLIFRLLATDCIEIVRVLHDEMDLLRHFPEMEDESGRHREPFE